MNTSTLDAFDKILNVLNELASKGAQPAEALISMSSVKQQYPDLGIQLVWQTETYDASIHYDVLVRLNQRTISLSVANDHVLPWPLRGVRRWTEANILHVNGRMLTMQEAVHFIDIVWNEKPIMSRMIDACLIEEELAREPLTLDDHTLQAALNDWRGARGLYSVDQTERWMKQHGLSHEQLESLASEAAILAALRKRIAGGRAMDYLEEHQREFDIAHVACVEFRNADRAAQFHDRLSTDARPFAVAMQEEFLRQGDHATCRFLTLRQRDCQTAAERALFDLTPGTINPPMAKGEHYSVVCVLEIRAAVGDDSTLAAAEQALFETWLDERRRYATIDWHWGRTPAPD